MSTERLRGPRTREELASRARELEAFAAEYLKAHAFGLACSECYDAGQRVVRFGRDEHFEGCFAKRAYDLVGPDFL